MEVGIDKVAQCIDTSGPSSASSLSESEEEDAAIIGNKEVEVCYYGIQSPFDIPVLKRHRCSLRHLAWSEVFIIFKGCILAFPG